MKDLPIYKIVINEDEESEIECNYVALVDRPATKQDYLLFREEKPTQLLFASEVGDKRILSGVLMLADTPIYRKHPETFKEFYTVFDKPTMYKLVQKFHKKGYQNNVNIMHEDELIVNGVTLFESFIYDGERGVQPIKGFEDVPEGTWFGSMHVQNDRVWQLAQEGLLKGFSIEGLFSMKLTDESVNDYSEMTPEIKLETVKKLLQSWKELGEL
jgi:hypothetical protein